MATQYQELLERKATLEREAKLLEEKLSAARREERQEIIQRVLAMMREHGITVEDLGGSRRLQAPGAHKNAGKSVAPKYRNPSTEETWTGRGLKPKWVMAALAAGKSMDDLKI